MGVKLNLSGNEYSLLEEIMANVRGIKIKLFRAQLPLQCIMNLPKPVDNCILPEM